MFCRAITSIIVEITYGRKLTSMDDDWVISAQKAMEGFSLAMVQGEYWVQYLPFLRHLPDWFPGTSFRKLVKEYLPHTYNMRDKPYAKIKAAVVCFLWNPCSFVLTMHTQENGTAPPSLARTLVEGVQAKYGGTDEEAANDEIARNVIGIAYAGVLIFVSEVIVLTLSFTHSRCRYSESTVRVFRVGKSVY